MSHLASCASRLSEGSARESVDAAIARKSGDGDYAALNGDDVESSDDASVLRRASVWTTVVNGLAVMFGAQQLPYAVGQMGWAKGLGALAASTVSTYFSGRLIGAICVRKHANSYPEMGEAAFGLAGRRTVVAAQWLGYFLTGVVQIAYSGATYQQTLRGTPLQDALCTQGWMLVTTLMLLPCVMVPSFKEAAPLSFAVVGAQVLGLLIFFAQIGTYGTYDAAPELPCYDKVTTGSALAALSNMAFTFGGHGVFPEQIREMREPERFHEAFNYMYVFVIPFYFGTAALGFWAFGNAAAANPLENLRDGVAVKVYLWFTLFTTFPLVVVGQVVLFLNLEVELDVLPTDVWTNSRREKVADSGASAFRKRVAAAPPVLVRAVFRASYVGAMYLIASALIGAGLGSMTNIAGALGLAALTYWMPYVLHTKIFWDEAHAASLAWAFLNVAFGFVVSTTGVYYAGKAFLQDDVRWFKEASCTEGAEFYGNHLWDNPGLSNASSAYVDVVLGCCVDGKTCGS